MHLHVMGLACFLLFGKAGAQTMPLPAGIPLTTATVSAVVEYNAKENLFTYSYSVTNSIRSIGKIEGFYVDIATASGGASLPSGGLINTATGYFENSAPDLATQINSATLPVAFLSQPGGWLSGPTAQMTAGWFGPLSPGSPVGPGQTQDGFVIASPGLVGLRRFVANPAYLADKYIPGGIDDPPDGMTAEQVVDLDNEIQRVIRSQGYTVGPVQPPSLTDVRQLIAFVAALKHQAASLQWICGRKFVDELDEALDRAGAAYVKGRYGQARGELRSFVSRLEERRHRRREESDRENSRLREQEDADKCADGDEPRVSDQAYFMLKADVEYTLSKLPEPKDGDDPDHEKHLR